METNFFQQIYPYTEHATVHIIITRGTTQPLIVSVMPVNDNCEDDAKNLIQPLNLQGSAETFDQTFFENLQTHIAPSVAMVSNMQSYIESERRAKEASQKEKAEKEKQKKATEEANKKYDALLLKVKELEEKEKYGEALGAMPTVKDYPHKEKEITEKITQLKSKAPQFGLGF